METAATEVIHHLFLLLLIILAFGMTAGRLAAWLRLPDVVLFIAAGMVLGQGLHWVNETSGSLTNQLILAAGSALILFDGGRSIRLGGLRKVAWTVGLLSVPGVLITTAVTGGAIRYLFGIDWLYAMLAAAVIASTDPASVIPILRQVKIRDSVRETVECESAFNDATGSIVTLALLAAATGRQALEAGPMAWEFVRAAGGGILTGSALSLAAAVLVAHPRLGILRDYTPIAMVGTAVGAYIAGDLLGVSGFMATFVAGLVWGNSASFGLPMANKSDEMAHFSDNATVMMRMLIFVLLGSQVDLGLLAAYWLPSLAVVLVLMFVARPLAVMLCALPDVRARWEPRELAFMMWVRETGVIPAALSGMIAGMHVKHADVIASVTFMAIVLTILVQGSTTAWIARRLGLEEGGGAKR